MLEKKRRRRRRRKENTFIDVLLWNCF